MFPMDLIKDSLIDRVEQAFDVIDHTVKFQNPSGNQWNVIMSFDLDKAKLNEGEKLLINALLKHL